MSELINEQSANATERQTASELRQHKNDGGSNPLVRVKLSFIGTGVMAEAIIAGLLHRKLVAPEQIIGSHPRASRREELAASTTYG